MLFDKKKWRETVHVDVLGSDVIKWLFRANDGTIKWPVFVHSKEIFHVYDKKEYSFIERFKKSPASWIIVDLFGLICGKYDEKLKNVEYVKQVLDYWIDFLVGNYGERIILVKLEVKDKYLNSKGTLVSFDKSRAKIYRERNEHLLFWQQYFSDKTRCKSIDFAKEYEADETHFCGKSPLNYQLPFYDDCYYKLKEIIRKESNKKYKVDILVDAYCNQNLGDDLFVEMLIGRYPKATFTILVKNKKTIQAFENYNNVTYLYCEDYPIFEKIGTYIFIGGSMFIEETGWKDKYYYLKHKISASNKKYMLGVNFGPYQTEEYKKKYQKLLKRFDYISVRDQYTFNLFHGIKNINCNGDIVMSLKGQRCVKKNDRVSIIPIFVKEKELRVLYENKMAQIANNAVMDGKTVDLIAFCKNQDDDTACYNIKNICNYSEKINVFVYDGNIKGICDTIKESDYVVGTRFHAIILAIKYGIPVFPIIYSSKTKHILEDIHYQGNYIYIEDICNLNQNEVFSNHALEEEVLVEIEKKAAEQFIPLDKQIKKETEW